MGVEVHNIYLHYIAPEDIHVYSIDEVFMDVTEYLDTYGMTARQPAPTRIRDVLKRTRITVSERGRSFTAPIAPPTENLS